jgi:hypothetical protein
VKYSLYLETEIYSPHLRSLLTCLETLTGDITQNLALKLALIVASFLGIYSAKDSSSRQ